jgi:hypothetical protein
VSLVFIIIDGEFMLNATALKKAWDGTVLATKTKRY